MMIIIIGFAGFVAKSSWYFIYDQFLKYVQ